MLSSIKTDERINNLLAKFYEMHLKCEINLTAIKEKEEFYLKHYLDSIYYFDKYEAPYGTLADIGSGGGFPGIVLAIFYPDVKITLVESIGKKCRFLEKSASDLGLNNVEVINDRVENIKNRAFDIITARGVAPVKEVLKNTWGISKAGTKWVMYKGERLDDELTDAVPLIQKRGIHVEKIRIEEPITRTYCIINR